MATKIDKKVMMNVIISLRAEAEKIDNEDYRKRFYLGISLFMAAASPALGVQANPTVDKILQSFIDSTDPADWWKNV